MDSGDALQLIVLVILLLLSAFFSSAETSLTCVNKMRIRSLVEEGHRRAILVQKLTDNPSKMLSAILIGNNIVNLTASSLTTILATRMATAAGNSANAGTAIGLATGLITILILIFGEITPKSMATRYSEKVSLTYAPIIYGFTVVLTPVIFIVNKMSAAVMRLLGLKPEGDSQTMTENELLTIIDVSHEDGVIETEEKEMITNVVDFGDSVAENVMIPRIDIDFLDKDSSYEEILEKFRTDKYSRIPVYEHTKDKVVGILNLKDVFCYTGRPEEFDIDKIMRKPYFTYEFRKTSDLMVEMQKNSNNMAIVLDEYGATAGLVTLEDLLEEIVGEIRDEYDEEETDDVHKISDREYIVDGATRLDDIDDLFGLKLESDEYDSIAGHVINVLGHIPEEGEAVDVEKLHLVVDKMDKNRIQTIHIYVNEDEMDDTEI